MKINRYIKYTFLMVLAGSFFASCEKSRDTYAEFLEGGEIVYSGKPDSLLALSGDGRIKLTWQLTSDPKITKVKMYWNNRADSLEMPVSKTSGTDYMEKIIPGLPEGIYTFEVYTYDNVGHSSIRTEVIGESFGDIYRDNIGNRTLMNVAMVNEAAVPPLPAFKGALINWYGVSTQAVVVEIKYTNESNEEITQLEVPVENGQNKPLQFRTVTRLPGYKKGTEFNYRTGYKPNISSIDTFYTPYSKVLVP